MEDKVEKKNQEANLIARACEFLANDNITDAQAVIVNEYPFEAIPRIVRKYTALDLTRTFLHDGAIDRYKGHRLVYTPALRILSKQLGQDTMPYHPNWKMDSTHQAYWNLAPTLDHKHPVARNGSDTPDNCVCCSQLTNSQKESWTLAEMGWTLHDPSDLREWNGLLVWFMDYYLKHDDLRPSQYGSDYFDNWYQIAKRAREEVAPSL